MHTRLALVRRPGPLLADGLVTHIDRQPVDLSRAMAQWTAYVNVLHRAGWQTLEAPPAPEFPDAVFVEDAVVVYSDLAILARSGARSRRGETAGLAPILAERGYRIAQITAPGTLDGGDVLKHDGTVWVGLGGRTNAAGAAQLADLLAPLGARTVTVPLASVLHLKSAATALPDGTVIGWPPVVDDPGLFGRYAVVPEEPGAHVVLLGGRRVLISVAAPMTATWLRRSGHDVSVVDISEFEKLEGCVTCLSVRLRGVPERP
ncbi:MAG: N(G),N(G)-dimethylarginine dimethylaminohydrolase [Dermatophilaceae bacterium]|nr:N(G),N(G)-dimethylarginine dimethylaminohydrolase [Actinomycetales bacterium]MBP8881943.1 N(G),N(G)-dimethylarginine dimethylaminohydrolase [Dermatophilaceae bacterium]MBP9919567.1 N(G),N(G)-dimethylarginine dimethylaminohydrolase [Dermatophilaceae bacterium]